MYQVWSKSIDTSVHRDVTDERKDGRTDGSVTISLCNFVGKGIKTSLSATTVNPDIWKRNKKNLKIRKFTSRKQNETRATQSVAYPLAVKPLKNSKFNCDLDL